jgi:hypothetical protein
MVLSVFPILEAEAAAGGKWGTSQFGQLDTQTRLRVGKRLFSRFAALVGAAMCSAF